MSDTTSNYFPDPCENPDTSEKDILLFILLWLPLSRDRLREKKKHPLFWGLLTVYSHFLKLFCFWVRDCVQTDTHVGMCVVDTHKQKSDHKAVSVRPLLINAKGGLSPPDKKNVKANPKAQKHLCAATHGQATVGVRETSAGLHRHVKFCRVSHICVFKTLFVLLVGSHTLGLPKIALHLLPRKIASERLIKVNL